MVKEKQKPPEITLEDRLSLLDSSYLDTSIMESFDKKVKGKKEEVKKDGKKG